jgi:hypothetical protein
MMIGPCLQVFCGFRVCCYLFENAGNVNFIPPQPAVGAVEKLTPYPAGAAQGPVPAGHKILAQAIAPR